MIKYIKNLPVLLQGIVTALIKFNTYDNLKEKNANYSGRDKAQKALIDSQRASYWSGSSKIYIK